MALHLLSRCLVRAPLLPVRDLRRAATALQKHPLGSEAIPLASPELAAALERGQAEAAASLSRYARRAAFRPTPAGLLAGVGMGQWGTRTRIATGPVEATLAPTWERVAALGRELIELPEVQPHVRLRVVPSLITAGEQAVWLALEREGLEVRFGEIDEILATVIEHASPWCPWPRLNEVLQDIAGDEDSANELLLLLVDRGVLTHDFCPPLVGPACATWMAHRLAALPDALASLFDPIRQTLSLIATEPLADARSRLADLPGASRSSSDLMGTLLHCPSRPVTLSRAAAERAAACAPLLFRLQEALSGPVAERLCDPGLGEQLDSFVEVFGAGAFEFSELATGGFGVALADKSEEKPEPTPEIEVVAWLAEALAQAAGQGVREIDLDPQVLDQLLPELGTPPSFEMFLSPAREPARAAAGTDWLLGLHAPAGASWGRFAAALGAPMTDALVELAEAEERGRPGEMALDVAYASSPALADLCAHPPVRKASLALCGWPEGACVTPAELQLVMDPSAAEPWALRTPSGQPVAPSPLHRVRSTTAPPGLYRLLAGWSFARQHAPWAFQWGPLAGLSFLPRVRLAGFVVAPASWRVPSQAELARPGALARWRQEHRVPAAVQAGEGDELLYLDLKAPGAEKDLARLAKGRVFEIWPPLDRLPDASGRRIEAVAAVVSVPEADEAEHRRAAIQSSRNAGVVTSPAQSPADENWLSFRCYGAADRQASVLFESVGPAVKSALDAGEIDGWFFLPYLDQPGSRHHLRVRAHAVSAKKADSFARRLRRALRPSMDRGDIVDIATSSYFRESARYGGLALMPAVERIFQAGSDLVLEVLSGESQGLLQDARMSIAVLAADSLAKALGLDLPSRLVLAGSCRRACASAVFLDEEQAKLAFRGSSKQLAASLMSEGAPPLDSFQRMLASIAPEGRAALAPRLPALLHVQAVRLFGPDPQAEALATYLWQRALDSLAARKTAPPRR
jgi:thiopeptide-type bacteriocin biosynthesis protein